MSLDNAHPSDYTLHLPDECLAYIFQFLPSDDRNRCSLVSRRWLRIEGQSRHRLSLNAQSDIAPAITSIFARFNSVTKLTLRCDLNAESINDETLILISLKCKNLACLRLYGCREITADGVEALSKNCALLKKLSCRNCGAFSAKGMNAVLENCSGLEELSLEKMNGITEPIGPGAAGSSLKFICLEKLDNAQVFRPLITASKSLRTLRLAKCLGPLDGLLHSIAERTNEALSEIQLECLDISNEGLSAISSCCPNLKFLRLIRLHNCTNPGIVMAAKSWRLLRRLQIEARRMFNWIGTEALIAVANNCPNLEDLLLTGAILTLFGLRALAAKCVNLERLCFAESETFGDTELLCIAANCKAMKKLSLKHCPVSDLGIQVVAESCPNLCSLGLNGVNLSLMSLQILAANCVNLNRLVLINSVTVGDAELLCIASNCNALKKLWIMNCPVSDHGIQVLASGCPNLVELTLKNCPAVTLEGANCLRASRASLTLDFDTGAVLR